MSKIDQTLPAARTAGVQTTTQDGDLWVFDPQSDQGHSLGPVAAAVWRAADGRTPVAGLVAAAQQADATANTRLVWQVLDGLADADLLTARVAPAAPVVDRRAALGVLGAAAMAVAFGVRRAQAQDAPASEAAPAPTSEAPASEAAPGRADRPRAERTRKAARRPRQEARRKQTQQTEQQQKRARAAGADDRPTRAARRAAAEKKQKRARAAGADDRPTRAARRAAAEKKKKRRRADTAADERAAKAKQPESR